MMRWLSIPGRADITPPAVSALRFLANHLMQGARGTEIDVYSEAVDIFQLHNQQKETLKH